MKPTPINQLSLRHGAYLVPVRYGQFGGVIQHGILESPVIFMARRHLPGLTPFGNGLRLTHQTYTYAVDAWVTDYPDTDCVSVVSLATAEWADVWLRHGAKASSSVWMKRKQ